MRRVVLWLIGGAAVVPHLLGSAQAQDTPTPGPALILSEGTTTCGSFIAEPSRQTIRVAWILGYMTGANSRAVAPYKTVGEGFQDSDTIKGWLLSYCGGHAHAELATAAEALRHDLRAHEEPAKAPQKSSPCNLLLAPCSAKAPQKNSPCDLLLAPCQ